jgi:hypothetical protein
MNTVTSANFSDTFMPQGTSSYSPQDKNSSSHKNKDTSEYNYSPVSPIVPSSPSIPNISSPYSAPISPVVPIVPAVSRLSLDDQIPASSVMFPKLDESIKNDQLYPTPLINETLTSNNSSINPKTNNSQNNEYFTGGKFYFVQLDMDCAWINNIANPQTNPAIFGQVGSVLNKSASQDHPLPVVFDINMAYRVSSQLCKMAPIQSSVNSAALSYPLMGSVIFTLEFKKGSNPTTKDVGSIDKSTYDMVAKTKDVDIVTYTIMESEHKNRAVINASALSKLIVTSIQLHECPTPLPLNNALAIISSLSGSSDQRFAKESMHHLITLLKTGKVDLATNIDPVDANIDVMVGGSKKINYGLKANKYKRKYYALLNQ